jgi:CheY-like chemotaxis protein
MRSSPSNSTIVLVDDEPMILHMLTMMLRILALPHALISVTSAAEALALLPQRPIALVITDYSTPEMDGLQLTDAIKATWPTTRVLLITAYDTRDLRQSAVAHRVDDVLAKPFTVNQLEVVVRKLLS